jgi:hypothetical protein
LFQWGSSVVSRFPKDTLKKSPSEFNSHTTFSVSLSIGWQYTDAIVLPLIEYEVKRPARRSNQEMLMNRDQRRKMLMNEWDVHPTVIAAAVRANTKVKNRRRKTVNNVGTSASKIEEVAERVKRNTKRIVFFQPSVSQEAMALTETAQKAHNQRLGMAASAQILRAAETKSTTTDENDGEDTFETSPTAAVFVASPAGSTNSACSVIEEPSPLSCYAISKVAAPKETAPALAKETPTTEAIATTTPVKAAAIVSLDGPGDNKGAERHCTHVVKVVVPAPMFTGMPSPGDDDKSTFDLHMLDDDEISQLTEASRMSINAEAEGRRLRLVEEANQRYLETKKIEERILKLEEEKRLAAAEAKQKKSWFVISPNKNVSPRSTSSPKQGTSPKRGSYPRSSSPKHKSAATREVGSSPKQRSPPKRGSSKNKAAAVAKKAPQRQAVIVETSDDEFST